MKNSRNSLLKIAQLLIKLTQQGDTGTLNLTAGTRSWQFFISNGVLNYAIDGAFRVRRWQRIVKRYRLRMEVLTKAPVCDVQWEYVLLCRAIRDGQIRMDQAREAIARVVHEVLFVAASESDIEFSWKGDRESRMTLSSTVTPVGLGLEQVPGVLKEVRDLQHSWQECQLPSEYINRGVSLSLSPSSEPSSQDSTLMSLGALLNGKYCVWDIAQKLDQSPLMAARMVKHFMSREVLSFKVLQDLPQPPELKLMTSHSSTLGSPAIASVQSGLTIACIDDSPTVLNQMDRILVGMGCRSIGVREPIQALPTLLAAQPDLIFLDLIMPVVTGYELCAQIRRASTLKDVPVVVLTSNDGAFDRVRANLAGAMDFMSKPVDILRIVNMLRKHTNRKATLPVNPKPNMMEMSYRGLPSRMDRVPSH